MRYIAGNSRSRGEIRFSCGSTLSAKISILRDALIAHGFKKSRASAISKKAMSETVYIDIPLNFDKLKSCGIIPKTESGDHPSP
ncbi:MAG: hypothetical protein D6732_23355 [Methanobacteriota archaeon]|nr:MAG: hypothetical protein D6732_23355 [Euryarchaeota archaeon]